MTSILVIFVQFAALALLAVFGLHRFFLVLRYLMLRNAGPTPKQEFARLPRVTVQLPIYNESEVLERLLLHVAQLDYPRELLDIQLLDDSTDTTRLLAARLVEELRRDGLPIEHITRRNRQGFKAGALSNGLRTAKGEFVAVFDADFLPSKKFLSDSIHYFTDQKVGMVQLRWGHLNSAFSLLTRAQTVLLDGHFQIEHTVRHRRGLYFNFNGTAGIWRKTTIEQAGGWQGDTLTEDLDLSYRAQLAGSQFVYLVDSVVPAELPVDIDAFKSQQHRWTKGAIEVLLKLWRRIIAAPISFAHKAEAFFHLAANFCYPILLLAGILILPSIHAQEVLATTPVWVLAAVRGSFLFAFFSIFSFYVVATKESRSVAWLQTMGETAVALIVGIGLSLSNSFAIAEAVVGKKSSFKRTPKTGIVEKSKRPNTSHRKRSATWRSWLPYGEALLAGYFFCTLWYAAAHGRYETIPFASLFFLGFSYYALLGFRQTLVLPLLEPRLELK